MNYFTLFGLPIDYNVDDSLLISCYQELQRQFHPDRFIRHSERERRLAIQHAATINDAYQTLKHPLQRAEYILLLHGFDLVNDKHTMHDSAFLMEQVELREQFHAISYHRDSETELINFAIRITDMINQRTVQMQSELEKSSWSAAVDTVRKLRFLDKLQQQVEQFEEQLLDC